MHLGVRYGFDRAAQDAYALTSYERANAAIKGGVFRDEIVGVEVGGGRG
jgi:acetyl-CoA C-acetyltransferase